MMYTYDSFLGFPNQTQRRWKKYSQINIQQYTTMNQNRLCVDCTQKKDKIIIYKREFNPPITGSTIPVDFCQKHLPIINFTTDT